MANELDETTATPREEGRDVNVIDKQIPITIGGGTKFFNIIMWFLPPIIGGIIWTIVKVNAGKYLSQLQQKIQHDASQIDNYLEQRVMILQNTAKLLDKAIDLDKETFTKIAELRAGSGTNKLNEAASAIEKVNAKINVAMENYPELKSHAEIADAMQQNSYLQREITAAREVYNDTVNQWNKAVYEWPAKQYMAAKRGYTTRIPFTTTKEIKEKARDVFF